MDPPLKKSWLRHCHRLFTSYRPRNSWEYANALEICTIWRRCVDKPASAQGTCLRTRHLTPRCGRETKLYARKYAIFDISWFFYHAVAWIGVCYWYKYLYVYSLGIHAFYHVASVSMHMQWYNTAVGARSVRSTGNFDVSTLMMTTLLYHCSRRRIHGFYLEGMGARRNNFVVLSWSYIFTATISNCTIFNSSLKKSKQYNTS